MPRTLRALASLACRLLLITFPVALIAPRVLPGQNNAASPAHPARASYTITVRADSIRLLHVQATMQLADTMIYMAPWGGEHIPDGWRTFVRNEHATDVAGKAVSLKRIDGRKWNVGISPNSEITLSYDVNVQHDTGAWIPDAREAGYSLTNRVVIVGRGLFILPSFTLDTTAIRVVAPAGWKISTAWDALPGKAGQFTAATRRDLIESMLMVGTFEEATVSTDGFAVSFAVGSEFKDQMALYDDATRRLLREHVNTFGGPPTWKNMQVIINPNPKVNGGGGGDYFGVLALERAGLGLLLDASGNFSANSDASDTAKALLAGYLASKVNK